MTGFFVLTNETTTERIETTLFALKGGETVYISQAKFIILYHI